MNYLGVDWGMKRLGFAQSQGEIASPLANIRVQNFNQAIAKVQELVVDKEVNLIVIGKPESGMGKIVDKVAKKLAALGLPIVCQDETLSSQEAKKAMLELGYSQKKRKLDHAMAAAIILQRYLDEH